MQVLTKILILLFGFSSIYCDDSNQIKNISELNWNFSADCDPLIVVNNCVNVESGKFFQVEKDFSGNTIDPLNITRFYEMGNLTESFMGTGFSSEYAFFASDSQTTSRHLHIMFSAREGFLLPYYGKINHKVGDEICINPRIFKKGYTNFNGSEISGKNNIVNNKVLAIVKNNREVCWSVTLGCGTVRKYEHYTKLDSRSINSMQMPTRHIYLLAQEIKPNGNSLEFTYKFKEGKQVKPRIQTN